MLTTLSRHTAICQSVAEVQLTGVVFLGAVSHRFMFLVNKGLYVNVIGVHPASWGQLSSYLIEKQRICLRKQPCHYLSLRAKPTDQDVWDSKLGSNVELLFSGIMGVLVSQQI